MYTVDSTVNVQHSELLDLSVLYNLP